jgi:ABC-type uncharacterized transport system auxiliary subunit
MKTLLSLLLIITLTSCSSSSKRVVDKLYYRFGEAQTITTNTDFTVQRPTAMGILGNRPMVAQKSDGALLQLNHNFWIDSPKVLLQNYLIKTFNVSPGPHDNILKTNILSFEKKGLTSLVSIVFTLVDNNNKTLFQKTYTQQQELSENTMAAFVKSVSKSLETITQMLAEDLK